MFIVKKLAMQNVREGNSVLFLNNGKNNKNSASTRNGETVSSNQKFAETLYIFLKTF